MCCNKTIQGVEYSHHPPGYTLVPQTFGSTTQGTRLNTLTLLTFSQPAPAGCIDRRRPLACVYWYLNVG